MPHNKVSGLFLKYQMNIRNITKKTILNRNAELCRGVFSKSVGLMFSANRDRALIFEFDKEKIIGLHMFFVFYPIDVLFLDRQKAVVELKENFRPFTTCTSKKKSIYAVEIPNGTIKTTRTSPGDKLHF